MVNVFSPALAPPTQIEVVPALAPPPSRDGRFEGVRGQLANGFVQALELPPTSVQGSAPAVNFDRLQGGSL